MRKKTKIILIVISSIILLIGVLLFLIFKTNLFLDTSDLVCSRVYVETESEKQIDKIVFNFKSDATVKKGLKQIEFIYKNHEDTNREYNDFLLNLADSYKISLNEKENTIIIVSEEPLEESLLILKKQEIKLEYEGYGYECN